MELGQVQVVHSLAAGSLLSPDILPGFHHIVGFIDVAKLEQQLPQLSQALFPGFAQDILGPFHSGHHGNQPLAVLVPAGFAHNVAHTVHVGKDGIGVFLADPLHQLWVDAFQADIAGSLVQVHLVLGLLPILHMTHIFVGTVLGSHLQVGQVQIVDHHVPGAQLIALLGKDAGKLPSLHGSLHQDGLALLHVQPYPSQGIGVFAFHFFQIHGKLLLLVYFAYYTPGGKRCKYCRS